MPAGCISLMQENLRNHIAETATFQTLVGAANPTAAKLRTHLKRLPKPGANRDDYTKADLDILAPYALVYMDYANGFSFTKESESEFVPSGRMLINLVKKMKPEERENPEGDQEFEDEIGVMLEEMNVLTNSGGGFVNYDRIEIIEGPFHNEKNDFHTQGDIMHVMIAVTFGPGA